MKKIEVTKTVWEAVDGKQFSTQYECKAHEDDMEYQTLRNEFVNARLNELIQEHYSESDEWDVVAEYKQGKTTLYHRNKEDNTLIEFDEDFCGTLEPEWRHIVRVLKIATGADISVPGWYYGK
jgi:hypothetical protein